MFGGVDVLFSRFLFMRAGGHGFMASVSLVFGNSVSFVLVGSSGECEDGEDCMDGMDEEVE